MKKQVENIISSDSKVAFVFESPHTDELFHKYPLAGESGREVAKFLLDRYDIPFGLIAKEKELIKILSLPTHGNFSIINISKKPLQKTAYLHNNIEVPDNIESLEKLKRLIEQGADFTTKHKINELNELKNELYQAFKEEYERHLTKHKIFIPCGRLARVFCKKLKEDLPSRNIKLIDNIPHPSRGWTSLDQDEINELKSYIKQ